jgi:hypothetical protein
MLVCSWDWALWFDYSAAFGGFVMDGCMGNGVDGTDVEDRRYEMLWKRAWLFVNFIIDLWNDHRAAGYTHHTAISSVRRSEMRSLKGASLAGIAASPVESKWPDHNHSKKPALHLEPADLSAPPTSLAQQPPTARFQLALPASPSVWPDSLASYSSADPVQHPRTSAMATHAHPDSLEKAPSATDLDLPAHFPSSDHMPEVGLECYRHPCPSC